MDYLNATKASNKAKFPTKTDRTPQGTCRYCKKEISKENQLNYTGGLGNKTECKPCRRKISRDYAEKVRKKMKANPIW